MVPLRAHGLDQFFGVLLVYSARNIQEINYLIQEQGYFLVLVVLESQKLAYNLATTKRKQQNIQGRI